MLQIPTRKLNVSIQNGTAVIGLDITPDSMIYMMELLKLTDDMKTVTLRDITMRVVE